tara:strand:+ start:2859 stop:3743 length:885 start_codon:yes stop_codon:yes gene_type:complete
MRLINSGGLAMRLMNVIKACLYTSLMVIAVPGFAWNAIGHQVVAKIAYDNLTPEAKAEVNRLSTIIGQYYTRSNTFVKSASWPDSIRGHDVGAFDTWHYIDTPLRLDGKRPPQINQPANVLWAIDQSSKVLASRKSNDAEKALFLRFYAHFVGDVHQPLHCVELYSKATPDGDQGGNLIPVKSSIGKNLHSYWDNGAGVFRYIKNKPNRVYQLARQLEKEYPRADFSEAAIQAPPKDWAAESYQLDKDFVYTAKANTTPSEAYRKQAQTIVQQRAALAGYRLAYQLNQLFQRQR